MQAPADVVPVGKKLASQSPWFVIAILAHVIVVAIASIFYFGMSEPSDDGPPVSIVMRSSPPPDPFVPVPQIVDRETPPDLRDSHVEPNDAPALDTSVEESVDTSSIADVTEPDGGPIGPLAGAFDIASTSIGLGAGQRVPKPNANPGAGRGGKGTGKYGPKGRVPRGASPDENAVDLGLLWLRKHQDADGRWDCDDFVKHDQGEPCTGPGNPTHDVGVTALALLAFMGRGNTLKEGRDRQVVRNGVKWLLAQQDPDSGRIGAPSSHAWMYSHAIAALALCEAYGLSGHRPLRDPAQKAINFIVQSRNPYGVWRYEPRAADGDTSITAWMVQALLSAKEFDLAVDDTALRSSTVWFDGVTDAATGSAGYTRLGEGSSRPAGKIEKFPSSRTEALTSAVLLCRCLMQQDPKEAPTMDLAAQAIVGKLPAWNTADGSIDMYFWYYASYALFQMGGRPWDQWSKKLSRVAVQSQRTDGNARGSWDPVDPWGDDGGRVYSTAIMVLCLEASYRYGRVLGAR